MSLVSSGIKIVKLLNKNGFQGFWVGGFVRNQILKRESDNLDIATDATPDEVETILKRAWIKNKPVGKKFGSILAIVDGNIIEITTFRSEGRSSDKRHPDQVNFIKSFEQDAKRRDFTINTLYFDPIKKILSDPINGQKDLKGKLVKFVGDPRKRIEEDALRMMRAVRIAAQLGFKLEKNSFAAIKTRAKYIQGISGERVKAELDKILLSKNRVAGLELLDKTGLLRFIVPEFVKLKNVFHKSKMYHLEGDVLTHTFKVVESIKSDNLVLLYAAFLHDVGKVIKPKKKLKEEGWVNSFRGHDEASVEIFQRISKSLHFSNSDTSDISWIIKNHDLWKNFLAMKPETRFKYVFDPLFPLLLQVIKADLDGNIRKTSTDSVSVRARKTIALGKSLLTKFQKNKSLIQKLVKGELIMKYLHLEPGPRVGQLIEQIKVQIVLGKMKNEKDLKNFLK